MAAHCWRRPPTSASRGAFAVNYPPKIQTLSPMITIGLTMTSGGWEMLSGPSRRSECR
jgi:hypothetical protein